MQTQTRHSWQKVKVLAHTHSTLFYTHTHKAAYITTNSAADVTSCFSLCSQSITDQITCVRRLLRVSLGYFRLSSGKRFSVNTNNRHTHKYANVWGGKVRRVRRLSQTQWWTTCCFPRWHLDTFIFQWWIKPETVYSNALVWIYMCLLMSGGRGTSLLQQPVFCPLWLWRIRFKSKKKTSNLIWGLKMTTS